MAKITIKEPNTSYKTYKAVVDTEVMNVEIRDAFLGVRFLTKEGEQLSVSMRDGGFEVRYSGELEGAGFHAGTTTFKGGSVKVNQ